MKNAINATDNDYDSEFIREQIRIIPLRTRLWVDLQMMDKLNWKNGDYLGDRDNLKTTVNRLIDMFEEFVKDGSPEGFKKL